MAYEVTTRVLGGQLILKYSVESMKDLFDKSGELLEVLGDSACGKCGSSNIFPRMRKAQSYQFYELVCGACGAKLSFGQSKDLTHLWPKRVDENGNPLDHGGWIKYVAIAPPKDETPAENRQKAPPTSRNAPPPRKQHPPDPPPLVELLRDPTGYDKVVEDLYYAMVDANGETDQDCPHTREIYAKIQKDKPHDKELIRRLFHYKKGEYV